MRQALHYLLACTVFLLAACDETAERYDTLIENGRVFDGERELPAGTVVGINGDQIRYVGPAHSKLMAGNVVDATGLIVSPGFIDPHTHAYQELPDAGPDRLDSYITQGITTIFSGNDGGGPVNTGDALAALDARGVGANFALFVGHGSVRREVLGMDNRQATVDELARMKLLVGKAMEEGALGLSSGLFYAPGSFAETSEVIELAKVAAQHGGVYESHIRDESNYTIGVLGSVDEALTIGSEADIPVHIAHIKALGVDVWGYSSQIINMIEDAQKKGQIVTADQYPWLASGTRVSNALIPRAAMAGGTEALFARLQDPATLPALKEAMAENLRRRGGPSSILLTSGAERWLGMRLGEYAEIAGASPVDAAVEIVLAGDAKIASFNMNEMDVEAFMRQPWVMTSSDGGDGHPRKYASFPEKYREYVVNRQTLSLTDFIHRSTGLTAQTFGLKDRGFLRAGYKADIVVFDPETFAPTATYQQSDQLSAGVRHLIVNGGFAIANGEMSDQTFGIAVRKK